ncbi:MAG: GntR family transcriptional regulator [Candidatus Pacebacteria bacterium]|nr:GntR family transcriptional regulator [Candidatus Paceibacterota bacterium]
MMKVTLANQTKTYELREHLRQEILRGKWQVGDRLPTEADIRTQYGVSNTTVREAVLGLVNDGLLERRRGSGTYVCKTHTPMITVVGTLDMFAAPVCTYYRNLLDAIQREVADNGYTNALCIGSGDDEEDFAQATQVFYRNFRKQSTGVLSVMSLRDLGEYLSELQIPHVSIVHHKEDFGSSVVLDYRELIRQGIGVFFDAGIENIAVFIAEGKEALQNRRAKGRILRWFRECGLFIPEDWIIAVPQDCVQKARDELKDIWQSDHRPEGLFVLDDTVCDIVLATITELEITVPDDLAVISASNAGKEFYFPVPLTQIFWEPDLLASTAWGMLQKQIHEHNVARETKMIPPQLSMGESVVNPQNMSRVNR